MGHTTPPLRVGFDGVKGYADPDKFEIDHHERVEVFAETKCSIRFEEHDVTTLSVSTPVLITGTPKYKTGQLSLTLANMESYPHRKRKNHTIKVGAGRDKK
jgi:hypothetical protein